MSVQLPNLNSQVSFARYRDADDDPQDVWYSDTTPTEDAKNDLIPEFSDIAYPLVATLVTFAVVRRRSHPRRQQETE